VKPAQAAHNGETATSLKICVLGSGSNGNATFVATERVRLLIDAGFSYRRIGQRLAAMGERVEDLDAVIITHEHADHVSGLATLAKKTRAAVYLTPPTRSALGWTDKGWNEPGRAQAGWNDAQARVEPFGAGRSIVVGDLEIDTFTIPHDAIDPIGCCLRWRGVKVGLATDLGYMPDSVKYHIRGCDLLILESNYDTEMLRVSPYPFFVRQRVGSRNGHLSNHEVAGFLSAEFDRKARTLVLAHLSEHNNHPEVARLFAQQALDRAGARDTRLHIARQHEASEVFEF
jgi:phosphoribosyl 1,2-cyclic phosphodiesterase